MCVGQRKVDPGALAHSQEGGLRLAACISSDSRRGTRGHGTTDTTVRVCTSSGHPGRQLGSVCGGAKKGRCACTPT